MATSRDDLKKYFKKNNRPTEKQFAELIDAFVHYSEDGLSLSENGNVGIGVNDPQSDLHLHADGALRLGPWEITQTGGGEVTSYLRIERHSNENKFKLAEIDWSGNLYLKKDLTITDPFSIFDDNLSNVFEEGLDLEALNNLTTFIDDNKRLPDIPTRNEMENDGLKLGAFSIQLLKKVEELTLYLIGLNKEKEQLRKDVDSLTLKLENLQNRLPGSGNRNG